MLRKFSLTVLGILFVCLGGCKGKETPQDVSAGHSEVKTIACETRVNGKLNSCVIYNVAPAALVSPTFCQDFGSSSTTHTITSTCDANSSLGFCVMSFSAGGSLTNFYYPAYFEGGDQAAGCRALKQSCACQSGSCTGIEKFEYTGCQ